MNSKTPLNDRTLQVLKEIIERYIRDGQPVGSKVLAEETAMALSAASIRNIMAELEEAGYLKSPHTSAGRIPTVQGYRLFVDSLLTVQPVEQLTVQKLRESLDPHHDVQGLVATASNLLSSITQLAGLVTLPKHERLTLRQVEFLPLSAARVLVILVTNEYEIQNRVINTKRSYSASELQQAGNYLTQLCAGKDLLEVRQAIVNAMQHDKQDLEIIMRTIMDVAEHAFDKAPEEDYVLAGEANLFSIAEEAGIKPLRGLFEAFTEKRDMLHLLDQCIHSRGMQIFIGSETGYSAFDACSLVTAPYCADGKVIGVLGVIGPTRMAYDRAISAVDVTARLLSAAIGEKSNG